MSDIGKVNERNFRIAKKVYCVIIIINKISSGRELLYREVQPVSITGEYLLNILLNSLIQAIPRVPKDRGGYGLGRPRRRISVETEIEICPIVAIGSAVRGCRSDGPDHAGPDEVLVARKEGGRCYYALGLGIDQPGSSAVHLRYSRLRSELRRLSLLMMVSPAKCSHSHRGRDVFQHIFGQKHGAHCVRRLFFVARY